MAKKNKRLDEIEAQLRHASAERDQLAKGLCLLIRAVFPNSHGRRVNHMERQLTPSEMIQFVEEEGRRPNRYAHADNRVFLPSEVMSRPADIIPKWDPAFCLLSSFADDRMEVALIHLPVVPVQVRERLCSFWGALSRHILVERMGDRVLEVLGDAPDAEYEAAGVWLDGRWHEDGTAMARTLWRLQCSDRLVSAALELHRRASGAV